MTFHSSTETPGSTVQALTGAKNYLQIIKSVHADPTADISASCPLSSFCLSFFSLPLRRVPEVTSWTKEVIKATIPTCIATRTLPLSPSTVLYLGKDEMPHCHFCVFPLLHTYANTQIPTQTQGSIHGGMIFCFLEFHFLNVKCQVVEHSAW